MRIILLCLLLLTVACRRPSKQLGALLTPVTQTEIADYSQYLKAGNELVAIGHEPSWSLTINPSKGIIHFGLLNGDSITTTVLTPVNDPNGGFRYAVSALSGRLNVLFTPDSCTDKLSGQQFDYRVEVDFLGKPYTGCGVSLRQLALLQANWLLTDLQGQPVQANNAGKDGPRLDISLTEGRVTGTTGCNRLSGRIRADSHLIGFGPLTTTRMACIGDSGSAEATFLNVLNQPANYQIKDGTLTLIQQGKPVAVFKKMD